MTAPPFVALSLPSVENVGKLLVGALAVAGAAFVGGLFAGALTQMLAKVLTAKSVPRPALVFVRLLGGLVAGVLAAMLLFQSGGSGGGWGWGGGDGPGKGNGGQQANLNHNGKDPQPKDKPPPKNGPPPAPGTALKVEVLGSQPQPDMRFYRIEDETKLQTLAEVRDGLSRLRKQNPKLKTITIVLYQNSPAPDHPIVSQLVRLVQDNNLTPDISLDPGRAP